MLRGTFVILLGMTLGGATTYRLLDYMRSAAPSDDRRASFDVVGTSALNREAAQRLRSTSIAERAEAHRSAFVYRDADMLETALASAATEPPSAARNSNIEALVTRLATLDAPRAATLARTLQLEDRFLVEAWLTWAERDIETALAALVEYPQRTVAIAMAAAMSASLSDMERVASALPPPDRGVLQIEMLTQAAQQDPYRSLSDALALRDPSVQRRAVQAVASIWARTDPYAALARAELLPAEMRAAARTSIAAEWARLDAGGFLQALRSTTDLQDFGSGLQFLLAGDPGGLLRAVEGMNGQVAMQVKNAALTTLADTDLIAALAYAEAEPPGQARDQALQSVASAYGRSDPDAALAWAKSHSASATVLREILIAVAASGNFERALNLVADGTAGAERETVLTFVANRAAENALEAQALADKLVAKEDALSRNVLALLLPSWVRRNPASAVEWMLANDLEIDATLLGNTARSFARNDVVSAAEYTDRLPTQLRGVWMTQVATSFARADPTAAMHWLERYQGQDGYDIALRQVVTETARDDPRTAVLFFDRANADVQVAAAESMASTWFREEPGAAAQWAASLREPRARRSAVLITTKAWAPRDVTAAGSWVLSLSGGALRDEALAIVLPHANIPGRDDGLLAGFSSTEVRQDAIARLIPSIAARNPTAARRLLDPYVIDPTLREQLERLIDRSEGGSIPDFAVPAQGTIEGP